MLSTDVTKGNQAITTDATGKDGQSAPAWSGVLLQVKGVTLRSRTGASLLSDISFHIEPGELVVLTGVSYSGRSVLIQSLAGLLPPANGEILIDGINFYANLKAFHPSIGYVPAEVVLPQSLTVAEVMQYGATLGLPRKTSKSDRRQWIATLLEIVGLSQAADSRVGSLSRIDKRKLNIAFELIGQPGLLLLDAPIEQLTPFEEVQITILLKDLSRKGLTVIQVDQRARSAGMADKVIFLAPGGFMAWFGPTDEAYSFLRGLIPRGVVKDLFGLKEAIEILANPQAEDGVKWANLFRDHEAYQKYVDDPLNNRFPDLLLQTHPLLQLRLRNNLEEKQPPPIVPRSSAARKFLLLVRRTARVLWREKTVLPMLVIPPLIALIGSVFSSLAPSDSTLASVAAGMFVFLILLTSGLLVENEIFKERAAYRYENRTKTLLFPYILSKVWLVGLLALYQGAVWAIAHVVSTGLAGGLPVLLSYGITISLAAFIGGLLGLLVSAGSRNAMTTTNWLLLLTLPQLLLGGSIIPIAGLVFPINLLALLNPVRYVLQALSFINGHAEGLRVAPLSDWLALAVLSICLIVLLMAIQQRVGHLRI